MTSIPFNAVDVPPFQIQHLISGVVGKSVPSLLQEYRHPVLASSGGKFGVLCAQAFGSEIYVGCSNGELIRFALQADDPNKLESYTILSRQKLPGDKPIDEIVIIPSLSRALVQSDHQIHFYAVPSLDPFPITPIRNVVTFAVDDQHLRRPPPSLSPHGARLLVEPVDFCVIKRAGLAMYSLKDRLSYLKEIPLPEGATLARRTGRSLCIADQTNYNLVDLEAASLFPILPLSQAYDEPFVVKPSITVIGPNEFLILSWTGTSTLGLFVTADGDPVRGTLQWPSHPRAICLDYPYITSLLPNNTIEIHSVETQAIVQVIGAPPLSPATSPKTTSPVRRTTAHSRASSTVSGGNVDSSERMNLVASIGGYLVPSTQRSDKMRTVPVKLLRS
ncbi:hypothetical protein BYT27DRAFT_7271330 [Phlegmacium glaucopus]|nr:hypothetical protein BYT27DRAFT_7271330 [Phlegmacium glaucopus]